MGSTTGEFTVKSAYHMLRKKREPIEWMKHIWIKGLPFKISFFLWRVWKKRIATDDNLKKMRMQIVSKCYCCEKGEMETMTHLILTAPIAQRWWEYEGSPKLQQTMKAIPAIVIWELWKRKNAKRHGKEYQLVQWSRLEEGWIKCNTDGASKGNPGVSSYGFCIRNENGDLLYAEAKRIGITTNMVAELTGIWQALRYCKAQGYDHIKLETDSLSLKNMIRKEWRIPWELNERIEEIHELMNTLHIHIQHIFREANQLADFITNTVIDQ
ncbi:hypothetical protein KY284_013018 [Solanum tuberosum]|nr:hypothetical protein KY284_013018 [Solanum tuberosum]